MKRFIRVDTTSSNRPVSRRMRFLLFVATTMFLFFVATGITSAHINSLVPSSIIAGGPSFTLRIIGTDFDESDTTRVLFDGTRVSATLISTQELRATIPANLITRPGIVRVTLEGFNSVEFIIDPPSSCVYSITIGSGRGQVIGQIFPSDGGTGTANVEVLSGCMWVANLTDTDSFVSLTSVHSELGGELLGPFVATGSGRGTLSYSVRPNVRVDQRNATIRLFRSDFSGPLPAEPFTVTQEGTRCPASAYHISPLDTVKDDDGGGGSVHVTAPVGCSWTAVPDQPWIDVSRLGGTSTQDISYNVFRNDGLWRSGNILISGKAFSVIQLPSDCFLRVACAYLPGACDGPIGPGLLTSSRRFRDDVLARTPRGQQYTQLYYRFSKEAAGILMLNPALVLRSQEVMQRYRSVLESMIKGEPVTLTSGDIDDIDEFLNLFAQRGSGELREALAALSRDLRDPSVHKEFNVVIKDGPKRELPAPAAVGRIVKMNGLTVLFGFALGGLVTGSLRRNKIRGGLFGVTLLILVMLYHQPSVALTSSEPPARNHAATLTAGLIGEPPQTPIIARWSNAVAAAHGSRYSAWSGGHGGPPSRSHGSDQEQLPAASAGPTAAGPGLAYSTYFGGGQNEEGNSIAVDAAGNIYVAGFTDSSNFPLVNASQPNFGGAQDAFVLKLDPTGTRLIYSTYIGGSGQDNATAIAVDGAGNAYITGFTNSTNFPVKNALQATKLGSFNAFVVKLNPGGAVVSSTLLGGSITDYGSSIAVDAAGNAYVAGIAASPDFPTVSAIQQTSGGLVDAFVAKIDPSGTRLIYSTYLGGTGIDAASSIAVDSAGNAYLTGITTSRDLRTSNAVQPLHGGGLFDAFLAKINPAGTQILYSTYLGGGGEDRAFRIAVDSAGDAYVTGDTDSINFPLANSLQRSIGGSADAFVTKVNPSGNQLVYSTYLGGTGIDGGTAVALDSAGNAYVTGFTASTNFPSVRPLQQVPGGGYDGFVVRLSSSGAALDYSTYLGGGGIDSGFGIATDGSGNASVMGVTDSVNFPTSAPFQPAFGGGAADIFVSKIKTGPTVATAEIQGKNLLVFGSGFDSGAKILLQGDPQKTRNDEANPSGLLFGKKVGKKIAAGQTVTLQVRNSDGTLSNQLTFTRP